MKKSLAALLACLMLAACSTDSSPEHSSTSTPPATSTSPATTTDAAGDTPSAAVDDTNELPDFAAHAAEMLDQLEVKGRAPTTGYSRDEFGQRWSDDVSVEFGHNGCDTRNDILRRDLVDLFLKPNTHDCVVLRGRLLDPYTGQWMDFERGERSSEIQIDHVVALSNAWQTGAQQLSEEARRDFANDPRNLLAVSGWQNQQKGAGDAATWLPKDSSFRCTYVRSQIEVKRAYGLWVTPPEKDAMQRILRQCPSEIERSSAEPPRAEQPATEQLAPDQAPQITGDEAHVPAAPADAGDYVANCAQARAQGLAPLHRGEPGYRPGLDGDNDGIACE
ncbi:Excalibur calcium-binding domain protein [Corynebacterium ciconiae DSM 44920]|uniref:GmrSD restriction endonuclease domain-containing protein n=1 Tax=Corynebacterium ciconiae TaxID=227319 RepID=UPI00039ABCC6|nr:DUF1524 domain-containing protein [Corynebacterium ciconiae]WKD60592.1 Excalibur calcium-binding domain protein [Corynebacterium ciconiae DSM 44920]